jgi:hypothetical protein
MKNLSLLALVLGFVACGGTAETTSNGAAGSSSGGSGNTSGSAGKSGGGSGNVAGAVSAGGNIGHGGSGNTAGSVSMGGSAGGGTVDERCPNTRPMGVCAADEAGAACQYNPNNGCLCYRGGAFVYPCAQVDPTCGSGGAASAPPPQAAGAGGISAKIALPPNQVCTCTAGAWSCTFGI